MDFGRRALTALGKVGIVLAVLIAFLFGMLGTVYLSLRTAEVKVPDVLGKDRLTAETMLEDAGLKLRVRGSRASTEQQPDTILSQLPESGLTVKTGIEVAVEVSRPPKEGERVSSSEEAKTPPEEKPGENANQNSTATNQNQNQNQNKTKNKNTNKNANNKNANNSNNANGNANANRNANNRNANANRNTNNRNANTTPNANRTTTNTNTNRRPPLTTTPPFNPGANRGTP